MNFAKAKVIIIICLVLVNIVLGVLCVRLYFENSNISTEEAALASADLSKKGVNVDFNEISRRKYELPIYSCDTMPEVSAVPESYIDITEAFFGISVNDNDFVNTPDGFSINVKDNDGGTVGASVMSRGRAIECYFGDGTVKPSLRIFGEYSEKEYKESLSIAEKFLSDAFRSERSKYSLSSAKRTDDGDLLCYSYNIENKQVLDLYINILVNDGRVEYCYANIFTSPVIKSYSTDLIDCVDAMYVFLGVVRDDLGDEELIVRDLSMWYKTLEYEDGRYYVIPVWLVDFCDSRGIDYVAGFDAIVGENDFIIEK